MNGKLSLALLALASATLSLNAATYELESYTIDWSGSMPAVTHEGQLSLKSLDVVISDTGKVESLTAVVDMTQIDVTDLEGGDRDKLIGHLKSDDFFHVEEYPEATFVLQEHKDEHLYGTITIRGVSKSIALPVRVSGTPERGWMLVGSFDYNRKDFGVDYQNSGFLGLLDAAKSKIIRDLIDVNVTLKLKPTSAQ